MSMGNPILLVQHAGFGTTPVPADALVQPGARVMLGILRAKAAQHEYVQRKLLATGDRELIEDSWRDDFWGWGPNRDGHNHLGKLWMQVREELRPAPSHREAE